MKVGDRGQVTIPKEIRDRFGLLPNTDVEFIVTKGDVVLRKTPRKLAIREWKGKCGPNFASLGYESVDEYIEDIRGR